MTMKYPISGHPESMYQEINEGVNRHLNGNTTQGRPAGSPWTPSN
jgi:hypothetical protein